jgi:hypothetical protein
MSKLVKKIILFPTMSKQNKVIFPHLFRQISSLEGYEYHQVCHKSYQTGATNGAETACNSGAP